MFKRKKRKHDRHVVKIPVILRLISEDKDRNKTELKASHMVTTDISPGGVGLFSNRLLPVDSRVTMEIKGDKLGIKDSFEVTGRVCYCMRIKNIIFKCGIEFISIPGELRDTLEKKLASFGPSVRFAP